MPAGGAPSCGPRPAIEAALSEEEAPPFGLLVGASAPIERILNRWLDADSRMQTLTLANKADYVWRHGAVTVQPMFKHLFKRVTRTDRRRPVESWHQVAPILRVDVTLTERTCLQLGQQGLGIPFRPSGSASSTGWTRRASWCHRTRC